MRVSSRSPARVRAAARSTPWPILASWPRPSCSSPRKGRVPPRTSCRSRRSPRPGFHERHRPRALGRTRNKNREPSLQDRLRLDDVEPETELVEQSEELIKGREVWLHRDLARLRFVVQAALAEYESVQRRTGERDGGVGDLVGAAEDVTERTIGEQQRDLFAAVGEHPIEGKADVAGLDAVEANAEVVEEQV